MPYNTRLGHEIERRRRELGLSQAEFVKRSGLGSQNLLSMLERGLIEKPTFTDLVKIAQYLGVTPNTMAEWGGFWYPPEETKADAALEDTRHALNELPVERRKSLLEIFNRMVRAELLEHRANLPKPRPVPVAA